MSLYEIIKALQNAQGNLNKQSILNENKDNELFKEYMRAVYDPGVNYWIKKLPKTEVFSGYEPEEFNNKTIENVLRIIAGRVVTGNSAKDYLNTQMSLLGAEGKELLSLMIDRSIGASVGDTMVLKTWPNLYLVPAYMRCSLLNDKTRKNFQDGTTYISQLKADGMYMSLYTNGKGYTRQGNLFPSWLTGMLLTGADYSKNASAQVLLGEVLVSNRSDGNLLSRQEGNGLLNSVLKGADPADFVDYNFCIECWDMLSVEDFEAGFCNKPYDERLKELTSRVEWEFENAMVIPTYYVKSMEEAVAINNGFLLEGLEGSVIKTIDHKWKSGTSPYNVKMKIVIELDLEITHVTEGTGKAAGMTGSIGVKSREGIIQCDVGTGLSDAQRKQTWEDRFTLPGKIMVVKANDIISKRGSETFSLFLPVAIEIRVDKTTADSYDECVAILNAAKG